MRARVCPIDAAKNSLIPKFGHFIEPKYSIISAAYPNDKPSETLAEYQVFKLHAVGPTGGRHGAGTPLLQQITHHHVPPLEKGISGSGIGIFPSMPGGVGLGRLLPHHCTWMVGL
jgi:hypothetical protein